MSPTFSPDSTRRTRFPAPGLAGGHPGSAGRVRAASGSPLEAKIRRFLPAGEVVTIEIPGGGGFGPPAERDPERVKEDVREGYVSERAAREVYRLEIEEKSRAPDAYDVGVDPESG